MLFSLSTKQVEWLRCRCTELFAILCVLNAKDIAAGGDAHLMQLQLQNTQHQLCNYHH